MDESEIIQSILDRIELAPAPASQDAWDRYWRWIADELRAKPDDLSVIVPSFLKVHDIVRYKGEWKEVDKDFVVNEDAKIRERVFTNWLSDCPRIIELGSGTGRNIAMLSQLFPDAELLASDYSIFSCDIIGHLAKAMGKEFPWVQFDMRTCRGQEHLNITNETGIVTVHAMEQLGHQYRRLFEYIVEMKPMKVVNIEPLDDLYDPESPFDRLALRYHQARGYLDGWCQFLRDQSDKGVIRILQDGERLGLGDKFHEAYSLIVWKPL